jgi:uncharacterized membrane protein YccC
MSAPDLVGELERWFAELARKWERFFAGDRQVSVPPERERAALERRLQELSRTEPATAGERFRMEQLLHRFATRNQLWQRQLREREEARQVAGGARRALNEPPPRAVPEASDEYRQTFARYIEALGHAGQQAMIGFEGFRDALEQQRRQIESGGAIVEGFEVVVDGGNVRVRARVRRGRQA